MKDGHCIMHGPSRPKEVFDPGASHADFGATFSRDRRYRYTLTRILDPLMHSARACRVAFIMLNPSTADAETDDPTIRRCIGFAKRWGHDRLEVVNLFAWRATDPNELPRVVEPVGGTSNTDAIRRVAASACTVVAAWGGPYSGKLKQLVLARARHVHDELTAAGIEMHVLGLTKDRNPRHPLYMPYEARLVRWHHPMPHEVRGRHGGP